MATGGGSYPRYSGFGGSFDVCKYPGCTRPRYRESYGYTHDFCGRTHAQLYQSTFSQPPPAYYLATTAPRKSEVSKPSYTSSRKPLKAMHSLTSPKNWFSKEIKFYNRDEPYYEFTNFYPALVNIDGKTWPTTEHYFQAQKFVGTPYVEMIRNLAAPRHAFQMSRDPKVSRWRRSDWDDVKDDVMLKALQCKFDQNVYLRNKLIETGTKKLIEHTSNDSYWGDGGDGKGLNKLGKLLMEVRKHLEAKYGPYKGKADGHKTFNHLASGLDSSEASRSVRGLASPMSSRKMSPLKRSVSFSSGLTPSLSDHSSSKQYSFRGSTRDDTSVSTRSYKPANIPSKPQSDRPQSDHMTSSQEHSSPKDDSYMYSKKGQSSNRARRTGLRRTSSLGNIPSSVSGTAGRNTGTQSRPLPDLSKSKKKVATIKETLQKPFINSSRSSSSSSQSGVKRKTKDSSVTYDIITHKYKCLH